MSCIRAEGSLVFFHSFSISVRCRISVTRLFVHGRVMCFFDSSAWESPLLSFGHRHACIGIEEKGRLQKPLGAHAVARLGVYRPQCRNLSCSLGFGRPGILGPGSVARPDSWPWCQGSGPEIRPRKADVDFERVVAWEPPWTGGASCMIAKFFLEARPHANKRGRDCCSLATAMGALHVA